MSRPFLRELHQQLDLVKEKLASIHIPSGPLAKPLPPEVQSRREALLKRKREIEESIINWKSPIQ